MQETNLAICPAAGLQLHATILAASRQQSGVPSYGTIGEQLPTISPGPDHVRTGLGFDKTTRTVLEYLATDPSDASPNAAWREPWGHLAAILRSAMRARSGRRLFLPTDRFRVQSLGERGRREKQEKVENEHHETNRWIETWLADKVSRWRVKSQAEIYAAALRGKFRNLANECQRDLLNEISRRNNPMRNPGRPLLSLDEPVDPLDCNGETIADYVVRRDVIDPLHWIEENHAELKREGIYEVTTALAAQYLVGEESATKCLADRWGVGVRQAQRRCLDLLSRIRTQLRDAPVVRELYATIDGYANRHRYAPSGISCNSTSRNNRLAPLLNEAA